MYNVYVSYIWVTHHTHVYNMYACTRIYIYTYVINIHISVQHKCTLHLSDVPHSCYHLCVHIYMYVYIHIYIHVIAILQHTATH